MAIALHLAVHLLGLTVATGLVAFALSRRDRATAAWHSLVVGGLLLAISHVATGALWTGELAWPIYLRVGGYAAVAVAAAGRLLGSAAPVVVALAPTGAHVAAGVAGLMAAFATARGVLGRGSEIAALTVGVALWAAGDVVLPTSPTAYGVLSVLGSVAVGGWLLRAARGSIFSRFLVSFTTVLLLLAVGLAGASSALFRVDLVQDSLSGLRSIAASSVTQLSQDWPDDLRAQAQTFARGERISERLREVDAGTRTDVDPIARTIAEALANVDVVLLTTDDGRVAGSFDEEVAVPGPLTAAEENAIAGSTILARASGAQQGATGLVAIGAEQLIAVAAVPVMPEGTGLDASAGTLVLGRSVATIGFVQQLADRSDAEVLLLLGGTPAVSTLSQTRTQAIADRLEADQDDRLLNLEGEEALVASEVITSRDGTRLGRLVLVDVESLVGAEEDFTRTLFVVAMIGLLVAVGLAAGAARRTTAPIRRLTSAADRVAAGDLRARVGLDRTDELGRLSQAFDHMTSSLLQRETDLRTAAETEAALRSRIEAVTASMGEALVAVDNDGAITTVNPAAEELLARSRTELVGVPIGEVLTGDAGPHTSLLDALGGPSETAAAAVRGSLDAARQSRPVSATAAPLHVGGRIRGRVYVLRDIAGELQIERMKTEFLSNISHELRTPLTPIKGYAEVLRVKDVDADRTREFATNIAQSALRLERIIGMLVDFASLEAGRMEVELEPTNLGDVVDRVLDVWAQRTPERTVRRRLSTRLPQVEADPDLLKRVLEELVDNALKFSDDAVLITAAREGDRVRVTVKDRGPGLSAEEISAILEDFRQIDGSATRRFGGLGLGLGIVQRILVRFDAELLIESEEGDGTEIHVYLRVAEGT